MKHFRMLAAGLCSAVLLCGFAIPAYAYSDGGNEEPPVVEETPAPEPAPTITPGEGFSEDGNLVTRDLLYDAATNKQFITVETKNGNVFYLIIDRDDEGEETVHFLNQVDEADLMVLTEDGEKAETPIVCTCTEKCQAGAVNTACPVCVKNLSECVGTEQKAAEPTEPENPEPEKKSNAGAILAVLLILAAGGGTAVYFLVLKPKQGKKVPADLDDFDLEDEEEYLTEDEETEEKNE